jgi:hypothetical protein
MQADRGLKPTGSPPGSGWQHCARAPVLSCLQNPDSRQSPPWMSLTCRVCLRLHSTAHEMNKQGGRGVVGFSVTPAWRRRSTVAEADDAERGAGWLAVGVRFVLGGVTGGRSLAAGIRGYTQAIYPRRCADRRLPVTTYPQEYRDRLRGCAAYPREYGDKLRRLASHRKKSGDRPHVAVDCDVSPAAEYPSAGCTTQVACAFRARVGMLPRPTSIVAGIAARAPLIFFSQIRRFLNAPER